MEDQERLKIGTPRGDPLVLSAGECGARSAETGGRSEIVRQAAASVAGEVSVTYHDSSRDYQTGVQRARRAAPALRSERLTVPAVLEADEAKRIAEFRLACVWAARASAKLHLGWRQTPVRPGALVRIGGQPGLWKVERWTLQRMVAKLELIGIPTGIQPAAAASPGRAIDQFDEPVGNTILRMFDLPSLTDEAADRPRLLALAAGSGGGWRRAELETSYDGGLSWAPLGSTAGPAILGQAVSALASGGSALLDLRSSIEIELANDTMWLEGRSDAALAAGANLAVIGDELIQFGQVEALGARRFRLSRLLRGRRGTEWAAAAHAPGEAFALIEEENLVMLELPAAALGGEARLLATGFGDATDGVAVTRPIGGEAMRPPSPVHLQAERLGDGDIQISWVRRSRSGWAWVSGSDTPLGEEREAYRVVVSGAGQRVLTCDQPGCIYTAQQQAEDGVAEALTISVRQLGTAAVSRAAQIII